MPGARSNRRYEASGVCLKDGLLHIVFDNKPRILGIRPEWEDAGPGPVFRDLESPAAGYEDIAWHPTARRWYCLIEAAETKKGVLMPHVDIFDESFVFIRRFRLEFPIRAGNKGFEGLTVLRHAGADQLLCLCEGNSCKGGSAGKEPGKGRIQVFRDDGERHEHAGTLRIPETVLFQDYAGLDCRDGWIIVVSQATSALWVGRLGAGPADPEHPFADNGRVFLFPRDEKGRIMYGNAEGVAWLGDGRVAVVSDKAKTGQPARFARKDQSVHIFRLPPGSARE